MDPHPSVYEGHLNILHPYEAQSVGSEAHRQDLQPSAIPSYSASRKRFLIEKERLLEILEISFFSNKCKNLVSMLRND